MSERTSNETAAPVGPSGDVPSLLARAQEWLGCDTPPDSTWCEVHMHQLPCREAASLAALLAEVRAEADPDDELARLRRWKEEALPVIAGLQELGRALGMPLGSRITGPEALDRLTALLAETRRQALDDAARWLAEAVEE